MRLTCTNCPATAPDTARERARFLRRHGPNCKALERKTFAKQLAQGTRSVEPTTWEEHRYQREDGDAA